MDCAATRVLPLRSQQLHPLLPAWPRDRLQGNALLCPAVGPDPGGAGGLALPVWPVHSLQSIVHQTWSPSTHLPLSPSLCTIDSRAEAPGSHPHLKPLEPKPSQLALPCTRVVCVMQSVCVVEGSGREAALAPPRFRLERHRFDLWVRKIPWRRAWQPTPVFLPEGSHGGGGWQATVHGVTKSHTLLKRLSRHWRYQDDIPAWGLGLPASRSPRSQGRDHDSAQGSGSVAARWGACVSSSLSGSPCSPVPCLAAPLEPTLKNGCNSKS